MTHGWQKKERRSFPGWSFAYWLKRKVFVGFDAESGSEGLLMSYEKTIRPGFFRTHKKFWSAETEQPQHGCFTEVTGDEKHMTSFGHIATLPDFVAETLCYGKQPVRTEVTTKILPGPVGVVWPPYVTESEIKMFDQTGNLLETLRDGWEIYAGLTLAYGIFTEHNRQCP